MRTMIVLLAALYAMSAIAEEPANFHASFQQSCRNHQQGLGATAAVAEQRCGCMAQVLTQEASAEEQDVYLSGNFTVLSAVKERSAAALEKCEAETPAKALKSGSNTFSFAVCKHWLGTTYHACKRTITGGHAWCFVGNDNLNPGDVLCKDAPEDKTCTKDTVQFGIIPTLLPKDICTFQ